MNRKLEQIILWVVKIGIWVVPFLPLYVSSSMLFPFITGKNFTFRILVEFIFALWAGLAVARPEYRPRLTSLFKAVTIFVGIVFLADLFSTNPHRAFFSNYERMEGFVMLGHLYLYFVILTSIFKTKRDWLVFFHSTLAASIIVSYIALLQKLGYKISLQGGFRVDSTIGNPTYLAAYLLFHVWLLAILLYQFWKKWWLEAIYAVLLLFELMIIYFTATRGAVLALVVVLIPFSAALVLFWKNTFPGFGSSRKWAFGFFIAALFVPLIFWGLRDTNFIIMNPVLERLTRFSFHDDTIQSRFKIWRMSAHASLGRPLLGWGQENYYLVFQKYFNPGLYAQEPWFDRSHDIIFDWLIHAGFLGLFSYLSIFVAAIWGLIQAMRKNILPYWQGFVLIFLFVTYFLQNIFVFDNLNTYLLFFAFLAYTEFLSSPPTNSQKFQNKFYTSNNGGAAYATSIALLLLFVIVIYPLHLAPIYESQALIRALQIYQYQGPMDQLMSAFKDALSYGTFGDQETREQLSNVARSIVGNNRYTQDEQKNFVEFAIQELQKETRKPAKDVKHLLFLGSIMDRSLQINPAYAQESEGLLQEAVKLSPGKQIIYFELAQLYLTTGHSDRAVEVLKTAWELDRSYKEAGVNLWIISILAKRPDITQEVTQAFTLDSLDENSLYRLGLAYQRTDNFTPALEVFDRLVKLNPKEPKYHAAHAALLAYFGRIDEARKEAEEAARLDPTNFGGEAKQFLDMLKKK